jgi:signal transduction histidine kinase
LERVDPVNDLGFKRHSLVWRTLLSMFIALTVAFALTGWIVQKRTAAISQASLEQEIRTSLQSYESIWKLRAHHLAEVSRIMSSMSDVRAAFMTRDRATIQDTAGQLWSQISEEDATFLVLDPTGGLIASLGGRPEFYIDPGIVTAALSRFPNQVSGYTVREKRLYYVVLTPVYVAAQQGQGLLNILLVAYNIDPGLAQRLKDSTNGSDFAFASGGSILISTLPGINSSDIQLGKALPGGAQRIVVSRKDYLELGTPLKDTLGRFVGELYAIRSLTGLQSTLADLRQTIGLFWIAGLLVTLALTYGLFRRVLGPVETLDRAAAEVIKRNYDYRVPVETDDELGRLAITFNQMCESIRAAREDLIRQEQIATIGRLSSSIVHDLRNPLAAIYGGAEMLVDAELSTEQRDRLAVTIYGASRRIQELLQDLLDVSRGKSKPLETCSLVDIVLVARDNLLQSAIAHSVEIHVEIAGNIEVIASRDRLERVFVNLIENAIDAMTNGGRVSISCRVESRQAVVLVEDTGPGISEAAWQNLFRPFASHGKKNGLGLGLALSRQVLLDHGGDLWVEKQALSGARFMMRVPIASGIFSTPIAEVDSPAARA